LRPAFEKEVPSIQRSGFKLVRCRRNAAAQTYTGLLIQNRGHGTKSWTKWTQFR
jgi:hypothetical protein